MYGKLTVIIGLHFGSWPWLARKSRDKWRFKKNGKTTKNRQNPPVPVWLINTQKYGIVHLIMIELIMIHHHIFH